MRDEGLVSALAFHLLPILVRYGIFKEIGRNILIFCLFYCLILYSDFSEKSERLNYVEVYCNDGD